MDTVAEAQCQTLPTFDIEQFRIYEFTGIVVGSPGYQEDRFSWRDPHPVPLGLVDRQPSLVLGWGPVAENLLHRTVDL